MLVAMAEDLRVVFIKLADRLHNMRTLEVMPPEKQQRIAKETLEIYAPLAHRLGIWGLKWQLEDLAFRYLAAAKIPATSPGCWRSSAPSARSSSPRSSHILKQEFDKAGLKVEISGRPKHIYSIYQKMQKYAEPGQAISTTSMTSVALRVLVATVTGVLYRRRHRP